MAAPYDEEIRMLMSSLMSLDAEDARLDQRKEEIQADRHKMRRHLSDLLRLQEYEAAPIVLTNPIAPTTFEHRVGELCAAYYGTSPKAGHPWDAFLGPHGPTQHTYTPDAVPSLASVYVDADGLVRNNLSRHFAATAEATRGTSYATPKVASFIVSTKQTLSQRILSLLAESSLETDWTPMAIADSLGEDRDTIRATLSRLAIEGRVLRTGHGAYRHAATAKDEHILSVAAKRWVHRGRSMPSRAGDNTRKTTISDATVERDRKARDR